MTEREKVLMAMSGGVDSSVAASVLQTAGYTVEGVTLKLFDNEDACLADEKTCCSLRDAEAARQVCLDLGIPHFIYNFTRTFTSAVIDRFCDAYLEGRTPNPCIDCNRYVKFDALQTRRRELGYDYVATGHYARRVFNEETSRYELRKGLDGNKDQSYVLYHLDQDTLEHMLFPLGDLTKPQVRELAQQSGFANAQKAESQDICFVPDGDYASFIHKSRNVEFEPGPIVTIDGEVVGEHQGLARYTIGQRKGIGVAARRPLYVHGKDIATNTLIVGFDEQARCRGVEVREVNLISIAEIERPMVCTVKTHYRQKPIAATVVPMEGNGIRVLFDEPQRTCAPGQAAVFYEDDTVIGGGEIVRVV